MARDLFVISFAVNW